MKPPIGSIMHLLQYNWKDEETDYIEHGKEKGHIFEHMQKISVWIEQERQKTMNDKNVCLTLTATQWSTIEDKKKFIAHFERFVKSGYKRSLFYKWFYTRLSMMFGFIAHYNIDGFYSEKFSSPERIERFRTSIREFPCYGDPSYTFSDVEKIIKARINYIPTK